MPFKAVVIPAARTTTVTGLSTGLRLIHRQEWGWCFTMTPVKVLVIDDHEVVVEGLRAILSTVPEFQVVGTAKDGFEAIN